MARKLTKPHTRNIRLDSPLGLLGVPPDMSAAAFTLPQDKVILIVDKQTALRLLGENRSTSLPS